MEFFDRRRSTAALAAAVLIVMSAAGARCERADSLCFHFASPTKGMHLELTSGYGISGTPPFTTCDLLAAAKYRMKVHGFGLEERIGTFSIDGAGRGRMGGIRVGTMTRNAVVPGWGSFFAGRRAVGMIDGMSLAATLYTLYVEDHEFKHLRNRVYVWDEKLERADMLSDKQYFESAREEAKLEANVQNKHRKRLAVLAVALYAHQLVDPFLSDAPPRSTVEAGGKVITLETPPTNKAKAFFYSLIRPGRGQFYQKKTTRGVLFSTLTLAAGLLALDYHNEYDAEANRYDRLIDLFEGTEDVDEKRQLGDAAIDQWNQVEDSRRNRNTAYIVCAGLWGWSLIDALIFPEGDSSYSSYAFELGLDGAAFVLKF